MDISKFQIPTLDRPNFGLWLDHIQSTTQILDIWDVMRGDLIPGTTPPTRDLLTKPLPPAANATQAVIDAYAASKATWSKKNEIGRAHV